MVFAANPLSLSVPEPAFETWLRDSGYLEILDERATNPPSSSSSSSSISTTTTTTATSSSDLHDNPTITTTSATTSFITPSSLLTTIVSLITINPFAKLTADDFAAQTPSWTAAFIGSCESYSFPSSPQQAKLRVHENIKRYARNYATLFLLFFACSLYQLPMALFGLIGSLVLWDLFKWCGDRWGLEQYPSVQLSLIRSAQCATAVILYLSNVQLALFYAVAVSYAGIILHATLRKLSISKQPTRTDGNKWFLQNKNKW